MGGILARMRDPVLTGELAGERRLPRVAISSLESIERPAEAGNGDWSSGAPSPNYTTSSGTNRRIAANLTADKVGADIEA